jgi:multiple sugar transport system permease protein
VLTTTAATRQTRMRSWRASWRRRETRWAYLFIAPWLIGFLIFYGGPMIASLVLSLTHYDGINAPSFTGLDNYHELMSDPLVAKSLGNTVFYTLLNVPLTVVIGLALAVMLSKVGRLAGFFRTVFYLPAMTPAVAIGVLFLFLLNGQVGLVNEVLSWFGVSGPNWTADPGWIKPGIVIMSLWTLGATVIIYLAALQNVPRELHEAARLDGAGPWTAFRRITLPMMSSAIFFTVIVNTIAALQMFTEVYTMYFGSQGKSAGGTSDAALFYVIYLFQEAFQYLRMGYASALAWLLFVIVLVITIIQVKVGNRFVYYETEEG